MAPHPKGTAQRHPEGRTASRRPRSAGCRAADEFVSFAACGRDAGRRPALLRYRPFRAQERQPPGWHRSRQDVSPLGRDPTSRWCRTGTGTPASRPAQRAAGPRAVPCCPSSRDAGTGTPASRPAQRAAGPRAVPCCPSSRDAGTGTPAYLDPHPDRHRVEREVLQIDGGLEGDLQVHRFPLPDLDALPRETRQDVTVGRRRRREFRRRNPSFPPLPRYGRRSQPISTCDICTFQLPRRRSPFGARRRTRKNPIQPSFATPDSP